jgi:glycogen(starch) synthase
MRVLHLTTEYPPVIYGGLGTAVGGWVTALAQDGITVGVLLVEGQLVTEPGSTRYGATATPGGRPAQPIADQHGVMFFQATWDDAIPVGLHLMSAWRPDVVHLHTAMLWYLAAAIQDATGIPVVYHVHSVDRAEYEIGHEPNQWLVHSHAQEAAIAAADHLIAISRSEHDLLLRYYPACQGRISTIGNGIGPSPVAPNRPPPRPPADGGALVLYSGRLVERKGIRDLTDVIPRVLRSAPTTRFVLAGGPPGVPGADLAREWLPSTIDPALSSQVHFTGWLSSAELDGWYRIADMLIVPSRYEPFGMVVLEGMRHALPIIACDTGGPAEILDHRRTGLLFPPQDRDQLTAHILTLVDDPSLRTRLGLAATREVHDTWSWPRLVVTMGEVYDQLVRPASSLAS